MARILIVDDASFQRSVLKSIVESAGHKVVGIAKDGKEAVELYEAIKPDLTTLDILMGENDGLTALRNIRKKDPKAKVIIVSIVDYREKVDEVISLGATDYVPKPIQPEVLINAITKALKKKEV